MKLLKLTDNEFILHYLWSLKPDTKYFGDIEKLREYYMFLGGNLNDLDKTLASMNNTGHEVAHFDSFTKKPLSTEKL